MIQYNMEYTASIRIDRHSDSNLFCNTFSTVYREIAHWQRLLWAFIYYWTIFATESENEHGKYAWNVCFIFGRYAHHTAHAISTGGSGWIWNMFSFFFPLLRWFSIVSTFFFFIANMCEMSTNRTRFQVRIISRLKIAVLSLPKSFEIE